MDDEGCLEMLIVVLLIGVLVFLMSLIIVDVLNDASADSCASFEDHELVVDVWYEEGKCRVTFLDEDGDEFELWMEQGGLDDVGAFLNNYSAAQ